MPNYLAGILGGFILAAAFQLLLTALSVAGGVSVLKKSLAPSGARSKPSSGGPSGGTADTVQKLNHGLGAWTLVTSSVALFFAAWAGVELVGTASRAAGAIAGLVIWGLSYIAATTIEAGALTSVVGSLFRTATSGIKSSFEGLTSAFSASPEKKMAQTAGEITAAVRQEIFGGKEGEDLRGQLSGYLQKLSASSDPAVMRKELAALLDDTEVEVVSRDWDKVVASIRSSRIKPEKMKAYASSVKNVLSQRGGSEQAHAAEEKLAEYLRSTGKEELAPDKVKGDIETLLHDPKAGASALRSRLQHVDKGSIAAMVARRRDIPKEEADRLVNRVDDAIRSLKSKIGSGGGDGEGAIKERAAKKIEGYLNGLDQPELRYEEVAGDVETLFSDPKAGVEALVHRARSLDRDAIKKIVASAPGMSPESVDRVVSKVEASRDSVLRKAERMKQEVERRVAEGKQQAQKAGEEASRVAATAAWWTVGTAVASGAFAVLGGITAVVTG